jgi:hypothetical protein
MHNSCNLEINPLGYLGQFLTHILNFQFFAAYVSIKQFFTAKSCVSSVEILCCPNSLLQSTFDEFYGHSSVKFKEECDQSPSKQQIEVMLKNAAINKCQLASAFIQD